MNQTGPCGHPETGKGHFSGCTFRTLEPEYGGHMSLFSFFSDFQPTSPQWPSRNPDSVPLRKNLIYLQNDTVFHCFQDSGGPESVRFRGPFQLSARKKGLLALSAAVTRANVFVQPVVVGVGIRRFIHNQQSKRF